LRFKHPLTKRTSSDFFRRFGCRAVRKGESKHSGNGNGYVDDGGRRPRWTLRSFRNPTALCLTGCDRCSQRKWLSGTGIIGYNVQIAVDTEHHLIVAHDVTNVGSDRAQLTAVSRKAREASGYEEVTVLADRGY
jgi:Transposase DDE domain